MVSASAGVMSELVVTAKTVIEHDERLRFAILTAFTAVLAVAFMVLLVSDQVQAAAFLGLRAR